jgi:hypothetical protein
MENPPNDTCPGGDSLDWSPFFKMGPRGTISTDPDEIAIFACEWRSQPHLRKMTSKATAEIMASKQNRALALAGPNDIVISSRKPDQDYFDWLRDLNFAPQRLLLLDEGGAGILPEIIEKNIDFIREVRDYAGEKVVLVPHYCSEREIRIAELLAVDVFGCDEEITLKYFNKHKFKNSCREWGVEVVGDKQNTDSLQEARDYGEVGAAEVEEIVRSLLHNYPKLIIRGTEGSCGSSVFTVTTEDVEKIVEKVAGDDAYLIEPFLRVISSPNDQWAVRRDGSLAHIGLSNQLFDNFRHVGNLAGQYLSERAFTQIRKSSLKIAGGMRDKGYRGVFGVDYIITDDGVFPIENNARMNGSTYCLGVVEKIEKMGVRVGAWKFYRANSPCHNFRELKARLEGVLYQGERRNGVFPIDCDTLEESGDFTVILFGEDLYHLSQLEASLEEIQISVLSQEQESNSSR